MNEVRCSAPLDEDVYKPIHAAFAARFAASSVVVSGTAGGAFYIDRPASHLLTTLALRCGVSTVGMAVASRRARACCV